MKEQELLKAINDTQKAIDKLQVKYDTLQKQDTKNIIKMAKEEFKDARWIKDTGFRDTYFKVKSAKVVVDDEGDPMLVLKVLHEVVFNNKKNREDRSMYFYSKPREESLLLWRDSKDPTKLQAQKITEKEYIETVFCCE